MTIIFTTKSTILKVNNATWKLHQAFVFCFTWNQTLIVNPWRHSGLNRVLRGEDSHTCKTGSITEHTEKMCKHCLTFTYTEELWLEMLKKVTNTTTTFHFLTTPVHYITKNKLKEIQICINSLNHTRLASFNLGIEGKTKMALQKPSHIKSLIASTLLTV